MSPTAAEMEFLKELQQAKNARRRRRRNKRRPVAQQQPAQAFPSAAGPAVPAAPSEGESIEAELERKEAEFRRRIQAEHSKEELLRQSMGRGRPGSTVGILPSSIDELTRLFILAEVLGKTPPGLSDDW